LVAIPWKLQQCFPRNRRRCSPQNAAAPSAIKRYRYESISLTEEWSCWRETLADVSAELSRAFTDTLCHKNCSFRLSHFSRDRIRGATIRLCRGMYRDNLTLPLFIDTQLLLCIFNVFTESLHSNSCGADRIGKHSFPASLLLLLLFGRCVIIGPLLSNALSKFITLLFIVILRNSNLI
jgi:hypothetical protein